MPCCVWISFEGCGVLFLQAVTAPLGARWEALLGIWSPRCSGLVLPLLRRGLGGSPAPSGVQRVLPSGWWDMAVSCPWWPRDLAGSLGLPFPRSLSLKRGE